MNLKIREKIPKVIHYCWFGGKRKSKLVRDCLKSWKKHLPDYEIIEWNETNSDLSHPFVKEAYKLKKWAFVSDYIRLKVLFDFGGIYLDTDMMVIKNFEKLFTNDCFFGAEDSKIISAGIIGASINNQFIRKCMDIYDTLSITKETNLGEFTIPKLLTAKFRAIYHCDYDFNRIVTVQGITIYPFPFFYPFPFYKKKDINNFKTYIKEETLAVHLWDSSWVEYSEFHYLRKGNYSKGFSKVFKNLIINKTLNFKYIRKVLSCIKESITKYDA